MELTIKVDIPALDRLAAALEARNLLRAAREPQATPVQVASAPQQAAPEPAREEPAPSPAPATEPAPAPQVTPEVAPVITLDAVQRAAAQLRDQGKLKAVTDMFPEFGIKKLSDLKGDKLAGFADRLREMGAKL